MSTARMGIDAVAPGSRPMIVGLGITEVGQIYDVTATDFAAQAVRLAAEDAGVDLGELDGLLVSSGVREVGPALQSDLGLTDLRLFSTMQAFGATAVGMVQLASLAVMSGSAEAVACVFADAPLRRDVGAGDAYGAARVQPGWRGLLAEAGMPGTNAYYAFAARRHMERFGTTSEQFGHVAVAQREWAGGNPLARYCEPLSLDQHGSSRLVADPLRLLDCCLVSNGGIAVIVTTAERARGAAQPAVPVLGWAQSHPGRALRRNDDFGLISGAAESGPRALAMAGVELTDIDVVELYDCYTYTVVVSLEDYGFCAKGEGGPFCASGALGPGGSLKLNTGGGQLSSYYLWGMTPLSEAVIQARGHGGERQVERHELVLVSGNGGILDHHSTLILGGGVG